MLKKEIYKIFLSFSPTERVFYWIFAIVFIVSAIFMLGNINSRFLIEIPTQGGSLTEGIFGSPRFINPLLAISNSDRDLTALIYSGLMRATPEGKMIPDLANGYEVSDDGRTYTFVIKEEATFQDGTPVSADDIIFTITMAQDPMLKSPRRASWDGVKVEKINEKTVRFTLPQPYAPFIENTSIGILPKHLWKNVPIEQFPFSQLNIEPIGSGPFAISEINSNSYGFPTSYIFSPFKNYMLGTPFISSLKIKFYTNEDKLTRAYEHGEIESLGSISPTKATELKQSGARTLTTPLPRIFGIFFNQNQTDLFINKTVRKALALATPKKQIVDKILKGYAVIIDGPIPPGVMSKDLYSEPSKKDFNERKEEAKNILTANGWELDKETGVLTREKKGKKQELSFSILTSNTPELKGVAQIITKAWKDLGVKVEAKFFETSDLNQNVIRSRRYEALLFGEIVGRELDLFSFWHSSQRNDPGLNIALYANITADDLLVRARKTSDNAKRESLYKEFEKEIKNDIPAIFLYSPLFIYIVPEKIKGIELGSLTTSGERFLNIYKWYIETDHVWPIFLKK